MNTQDNGGPAFPASHNAYHPTESHDGMTLRDYFAAKAMQSIIATPKPGLNLGADGTASISYEMADAMLKARNN